MEGYWNGDNKKENEKRKMEIEETEKKRIRKNKKYDGRLSERMCGL